MKKEWDVLQRHNLCIRLLVQYLDKMFTIIEHTKQLEDSLGSSMKGEMITNKLKKPILSLYSTLLKLTQKLI